MKQYYSIKAVHPDAILLFRVGDFYETFGEDAIKASGILGITLTRRANGAATYVELAGFPYHAIDTYLPKLVRAGERVAICEQLEDPKLVKGLVKRGVIELVTPGIVLGDNILANKENNFIAAIYFGRQTTGVSFLDISTGEFYVAEGTDAYVDKLLSNLQPKEVVYQRGYEDRFTGSFGSRLYTYRLDEWVFSEDVNREKLCRQFGTTSLKGFGVDHFTSGISAAGAILYYLEFTEHRDTGHIASISRIDQEDYVWVDKFTIRNLELFSSNGAREKCSFADVIDRTLTPMGGRLLKRWIAMPIKDPARINERLDVVERFTKDAELSEVIREQVSLVGDLERIAGRIAAQRVTPRELVQLKNSLSAIETLKAALDSTDDARLHTLSEGIDVLADVRERIAREIYPDPQNNQIQKGGVIADGVDPELDDLRRIALHGKDYLARIQQRESEATGIPSLKISYNNVFGYYIEVRNAHKDKVPETWIRKQTLTNAERYITEELKEYEEKILGAEEKMLIKATSSGTRGKKSVIGFELGGLWSGFHMVWRILRYHRFLSPVPTNYLILGYQPHRSNQTAVAKTATGYTYITPAIHREYALKYKDGGYQVDFDGLIRTLERYSRSRFPTRFMGFPAYTYFLMEELERRGLRYPLPKNSKIFLGGGWKQFYREKVDKETFYAKAWDRFAIPEEHVYESFGAVEHPIFYNTCKHHHFHVPIYARVLIRDVRTLEPLPMGQAGLVNLITPLNRATPVTSVVTDDLGVLRPGEDCGCGINSPYLTILGRVGMPEIQTCAAGAAELLGRGEGFS